MISLGFTTVLLALTCLGRLVLDDGAQVVLFAGVLGLLVVEVMRKGMLTNLGAFLLLAFLMYGIRPLYIYFENDFSIVRRLMGSDGSIIAVSYGMFLATTAMLAVCAGHALARVRWPAKAYAIPRDASVSAFFPPISGVCALFLLGFQLLAVAFLFALRGPNAMSLYGAAGGAYTYLFPQLLQAAQIYILVVFVHNRREAPPFGRVRFYISVVLFGLFTFLMKDVSMFRGFYVTGAIGAFVAVVYAQRGRVAYWVLALPILFLLPAFRALGEARLYSANKTFSFALEVATSFSPQKWWSFFDRLGDMNVFDTFVAAVHSTPAFKPYLMAWLYTLLHYIPRAWWPGKPLKGTLVDMSFVKNNPYHPGLAGFYYLDGGLLWMLLSCLLTGGLLYALDRWVYCSRPGYLRSALFGILIINSLYAARGYLHFQVIQYVYMVLPVVLLAWAVNKFGTVRPRYVRPLHTPAKAA